MIQVHKHFSVQTHNCVPRRALTLESGMGMCRCHDPFFEVSRHSLAYQFILNAPLMCPPLSIFRKILHFHPCFGKNFSSQGANFPNFHSKTPHFSRKICSLGPTFGNSCGTHPPKKIECPQGRVHTTHLEQIYHILPCIMALSAIKLKCHAPANTHRNGGKNEPRSASKFVQLSHSGSILLIVLKITLGSQ